MTDPPVPSNTYPFGAFFNYAAEYWKYHLGSAPVGFSLDDVLELANPTLGRHRAWVWAWAFETCGHSDSVKDSFVFTSTLGFLASYGNSSMLNQLLDRLALNADGDRESIVKAGKIAIRHGNFGNFRVLMNHRSTAMAVETLKMLEDFTKHFTRNWRQARVFHDGDKTEWAKLITGLFDTLASGETIPSLKHLLVKACYGKCMPIIEKIFEQAKANPTFQEQIMRPTKGKGPLGEAVFHGHIKILRYLCQQDGIEVHATNRGDDNNLLAYCYQKPKVERSLRCSSTNSRG